MSTKPALLQEEAPVRPVSTGTLTRLTVTSTRFVDGTLEVAIASLAWWTVVNVALLLGAPMAAGALTWGIGTAGLAWIRSRGPWLGQRASPSSLAAMGAFLTALAMTVLSSALSRPDGDDASFVVRSTWVAEHGVPATRDVIFSDGVWPDTIGSAKLSSIETLFGALARYTGLPTGDVVYRYFVPAATFAAVWAVWLLLRVWGARRPAWSLVVAMVVVLLGGYSHATFGNMHLARIWQGKVVLVAIIVPYLYAVLFTAVGVWHRRNGAPQRWSTPIVLIGTGLAGVGASSTAVFLLPLIALAAVLPLIWRRQLVDSVVLAGAVSIGPVAAGIVTVLSTRGSGSSGSSAAEWVWTRVLADGRIEVLVLLCALVVVAGVRWPRWFGSVKPRSQAGVATVLACGLAFTLPPLYPVLTSLTAGDAVAWRLAWVVPLPAVIGLVASLPARRWAVPVVPLTAVALAVLLVAGQPLWSTANLAHLGRLGTWKVRSQDDLAAAWWIVDQRPTGRYLAPNWVGFMVGVTTSDLRPVGTRLDYVRSLDGIPGSQVDERVLLQGIADGGPRQEVDLGRALEALDRLDVSLACVVWTDSFTDELMARASFSLAYAQGPWTCWIAPGA